MAEYRTVSGYGRAEFEEKRSVFIGSCDFVTTEDEATAFVKRIREEFPDARHNVYAYLLREGAKTRYSDDREPQGTAGLPILDVLRKNECYDTVIVVTRYFGGILLGTGGLVRAYTESAVAALSAAGQVLRRPALTFSFSCSYAEYPKCERFLKTAGVTLGEPLFGAEVTVTYTVPEAEALLLSERLFDETSGRIVPRKIGEGWQRIAIC